MMFRAISEIASAIIVWSVLENPIAAASAPPRWRAVTMSASRSIATHTSSATMTRLARRTVEVREALLEIQRGRDAVERQPELDHRARDVGLDPDAHRAGAAQLGGVRDRAQRAGRERVDHVELGDVEDHAAAAELAALRREVVAELAQLGVGQRGPDRRDEHVALLE